MSFYALYPGFGSGGGGGGGITSINGDTTAAQLIVAGSGITVSTVGGTTTITNTSSAFTAGNLTDVGTDGITITGGTNAVNGAGTSISQHVADATHNGYLSQTDWTTFNNKQSTLTLGNLTDVGTDGITVTGGTGSVVGAGTSISQHVADATHNGYLSQTDWSTFNNKQAALSFGDLTDVGTDGITVTNGTGSVIGSGTSLSQHVADATHNGYLSQTDWSTFNNKQPAGSYITALTGDVSAAGPGSSAATLATVNADVGTFGDSTHVGQFTVNAKGLITAASNVALTANMNGFIQSTAGGGTTTLTNADNQTQTFSSLTSNHTVKLPTTGVVAGDIWVVINPNPYTLTVQSSGANTILTNWGCRTIFQAAVNTPTTAGDWYVLESAVLYGRTWQTVTLTYGGVGTVVTQQSQWMRSGANMLLMTTFTVDTPSAGAAAEIGIPQPGSGLNIDTSNVTGNKSSFGDWHQLSNGAAATFSSAIGGVCIFSGGGSQVVRLAFESSSNTYTVDTANTFLSATFPVNAGILTIPIAEWAEV